MSRRPRPSTDVQARAPIGREAAAAVFARAAELDVERLDMSGGPDGLDTEELLQIGTSAGLSPAAMRQALAELRGGAIGHVGHHDALAVRPADLTWVGPRGVLVQRVVDVPPDPARSAARRFLREQLFEPERDTGGRSTWRRREGLAAGAQRVVTRAFRRLDLDGVVDPVALVIVEEPGSDGTRTLVRFEADLAPTRSWLGWTVGGGAAATGAITGGVAVAALGPEILFVLTGLPAAGAATGGGVAIGRRTYRRHHDRTATCLEAFLDRLEQGRT